MSRKRLQKKRRRIGKDPKRTNGITVISQHPNIPENRNNQYAHTHRCFNSNAVKYQGESTECFPPRLTGYAGSRRRKR